ncbi:MAG: RNA methyltransferase [Oligoflexales bacterium]|nr:RNA methyltransferase [Oligoflexales bacterium]
MITSVSNPLIKHIRRLQQDRRFRSREESFVSEGTAWFKEWLSYPEKLVQVFYTETWLGAVDHKDLLAKIKAPCYLVSDQVMRSISDTESPPGILMQAKMISLLKKESANFFLILDAVTDPGNLGAMLRSAPAAGVDVLILAPGCVDAYNPKVVRSAMGAHLRIPIMLLDWQEIAEITKKTKVWIAEANQAKIYTEIDWTQPSTLVIGNEARGPSAEARKLMEASISIPMAAATESLNAAVAAAVILFEAARQRRK